MARCQKEIIFCTGFFITLLFTTIRSQTIEAMLTFYSEGENQRNAELPDRSNLLKEYDFIIVGAGTAGCTLANRLSEIHDWKILLIEAGDSENLIMDVPILANILQFTEANWKFKTEPGDRYCLGFKNGQCSWPRGKVMGGSSVLNYMIYTRGNRRDYDLWSQMGNTGWSWDEVQYYFKKVENFKIANLSDHEYHGKKGYLDVANIGYVTEAAKAWVEASQQAGYKKIDYDGKTQTGTSLLHTTLRGGRRLSSNRAYLYPIRSRGNLHVSKRSTVLKLLLNSEKKVIGVEYNKNDKKHRVYARKEVILSAGAINSPKLLMLSGIGPQEDLKELKIPVIKNLSVGYNLMDHIAGMVTFTIEKPNLTLNINDLLSDIDGFNRYIRQGEGPFGIPGGCEALTFIDLKNKTDPDGWTNMEHLFISGAMNDNDVLRYNVGFQDELYEDYFGVMENTPMFTVLTMLMRPKSKGRIKLKNTNPMAHPLIYPNYYANEEDLRTMVSGMKEAIRIGEQPALKKLGAKIHNVVFPPCKDYKFGSNEYWACHAMHLTFTIYHISGMCKMGPANDPTAVVDPRLRVHGIQGLRVIDVSIMPEVPAGHTNGPVYMIAEKGADMIKEDWGQKTRTEKQETIHSN